jgi:hypothetical protein
MLRVIALVLVSSLVPFSLGILTINGDFFTNGRFNFYLTYNKHSSIDPGA